MVEKTTKGSNDAYWVIFDLPDSKKELLDQKCCEEAYRDAFGNHGQG